MSQRCAHTFYPWLPVPPPWGNYPCLHLGEWIEVLRRHCDVSQGHKTENWLGYDLNQGSIWPMAHPLSINIHHAFPFCRDSLHQQQLQHILMTLTSKGLHSQGEETKEGSCLPSSKRVTQTSDTHSQSPSISFPTIQQFLPSSALRGWNAMTMAHILCKLSVCMHVDTCWDKLSWLLSSQLVTPASTFLLQLWGAFHLQSGTWWQMLTENYHEDDMEKCLDGRESYRSKVVTSSFARFH